MPRLCILLLVPVGIWLFWQPDTLRLFLSRRPESIIIHHSASPPRVHGRPVDAAAIDAMHARRGFGIVHEGKVYHIGYHYVVLPDGTVQAGRPEECVGAHARHVNEHSLGICLVGNFHSAENPSGAQGPVRPTPAQMDALIELCARLCRTYRIPVERVCRHRDVGETACPGDRFPFETFQSHLRERVERGGRSIKDLLWQRGE
ncbi:MAG TPA: peptidoglycan recognition family protein [Armatimonadota bacterium]|nr:N-acetylmuramoyl-L-alanine amidase [Armatimonadota bacterium]HOJ22439.1 peptidoglycan recognition family protein [Armatimonadota bacterium]HOM81775.1 peptidoglycan recognition family protein [Armatimonadota bacterium]HPO72471.1 peptidoglycan recognition family protein [Armatimonadota bacterium]